MGIELRNVRCDHCGLDMPELTVNVLPMACPGCGAPLLALCRLTWGGEKGISWEQTPAFPATVTLTPRATLEAVADMDSRFGGLFTEGE